MKKIALIVDNLDVLLANGKLQGGGSHVLRQLLYYLMASKDCELDVFAGTMTLEKPEGINNVFEFGHSLYFDVVKAEEAFEPYKNNYDKVVFGYGIAPFGTTLLQAHSFAYRNELYSSKIFSSFMKWKNRKKLEKEKKLFERQSPIYFAMSEKIKEDYSSHFDIDKDKIVVVYPGCSLPEVQSEKTNSDFIFGFAGGLNINKGIFRFLSAFRKISDNINDVKAIIINNKPKKAKTLNMLVKFLGLKNKVSVIDFQSEMADFYNQIDVMTLPSRHEAFGLVALEAASYKKIPLVSNSTGFAEVAKEDHNGFIFDVTKNPVKNLSEKMIQIYNLYKNDKSKYNEIKNDAYEIAKKYTWEGFCSKIFEKL